MVISDDQASSFNVTMVEGKILFKSNTLLMNGHQRRLGVIIE